MSSRHRWDRIAGKDGRIIKCRKCGAEIEYVERYSNRSACSKAIDEYFITPSGGRILITKGVKRPPCTGGEK